MRVSIIKYAVNEVSEYINWLYFFHAWGFAPCFATIAQVHDCYACQTAWIKSFPIDDQAKAKEALKLMKDAKEILADLDSQLICQAIFKLFDAYSKGDDLLIGDTIFPLLRQQYEHNTGNFYLCLSDFVRPFRSGMKDKAGVFAASVDDKSLTTTNDSYRKLLIQTISDRLVEASVEKMHLSVRRKIWGYAPNESLSINELLQGKYQGIRPAVGYPSLPDQSVNFIIDQLINLRQIGITLTENGAMNPHASVSGLMLAHPQACYFTVGKIGEDQLKDYSQRRGLPVETMRKFLSANL